MTFYNYAANFVKHGERCENIMIVCYLHTHVSSLKVRTHLRVKGQVSASPAFYLAYMVSLHGKFKRNRHNCVILKNDILPVRTRSVVPFSHVFVSIYFLKKR